MRPLQELLKWHPILSSTGFFLAGTAGTRVLIYVSKQMPPLPKNAGFFTAWAYRVMKGASGLDPNKSLLDPSILKAAGVSDDTIKQARKS